MLGLPRGIVKVVAYSEAWPRLYLQEMAVVQRALGALAVEIQHIGSTAVPQLAAKPIIDLGVGISSVATVTSCVPCLQDIGYQYFGDQNSKGDYFFAKGPEDTRTHYLHLMVHNGAEWQKCLLFRDYLRNNDEARAAYQRLKQALARAYGNDRYRYTEAKAAFIQQILREATSTTSERKRA